MSLFLLDPACEAEVIHDQIAFDDVADPGLFAFLRSLFAAIHSVIILSGLFCFSRTPSYRPPRRRQYGRPRRFSPYRPSRGGRGVAYSGFLRRDSRSPPRGVGAPPPRSNRPPPKSPRAPTPVSKEGSLPPAGSRTMSLNERFEGLLETAMRQRRREHGAAGGLTHLLQKNRLKLPLPTLMREAKELSVVIERNLPPGLYSPYLFFANPFLHNHW